jgi:hypothetical protein
LIAEIHRADWTIHFPTHFDEGGIPTVFQPLTRVEHEWEAFPWHLARGLVGLLEKPQSSFDYYQVTAFFRARAAMLALRGDVLYQKNWHAALVRHQVQVGGIYREHLLYFLRAFLKKHNFGELPECEVDALDLFRDSARTAANRDLIQGILRWVESNCVNTFNFISLAAELGEKVCGHTVGHWVKGADKPPPEDVHVLIRRHETGHDVLPSEKDAKESIRAGRNVTKSVVRVREEAAEGRRSQTTDGRPQTEDPLSSRLQRAGRRMKTTEIERATAKVAAETLAPVVEIFEKAILASTPPHRRKWWQNLRDRYGREEGPREADKWLAVTNMVVTAALEEMRKPVKERHSDYLTPRMLGRLLAKLNAPGASRAMIAADFADTLRRSVIREEQKAANP